MKTKEIIIRLIKLGEKYRVGFYSTLFIAVLLAFVSSYRPVLMRNAIDIDIVKNHSYYDLNFSIFLILIFLLLEAFLQFLMVYCSSYVAQNVIKELRVKLYRKLLSFKLSFFDKTPNGVLVTRSVSDIETISTVYTDGVLMVLGDILRIVFVLFVMFFINWQLALISFMVLPAMIVVTRIFQKAIKKAFTEERTQVAIQNSFVQERLSGMYIIQAFNQQKKEFNKFFKINLALEKAYLKTVFYFSLFFPVVEVIAGIALGSIIYYGGYSVFHNYNVTAGDIIAFITYINMLVRPMRQIADRFNTLQRGLVGAERVFSLIDSDHTTVDKGVLETGKVKGDISFDNVGFSYNGKEKILKNITFDIKSGEKIAIVGATGAGKSTIINLLGRFYDLSSGHIYIDNTDIEDFKLEYLRKNIAVVLQDVFLFNGTILENIVMGDKSITLEKVREIAEDIGMDEFIMNLPNDYSYVVSERGASLSLGQRQLISFLRAYIYNPSILILDEATSSIDINSEILIKKATDKITKGRTSIIIAHRLSTIQNSDKIVVLDKGEIMEMGTHEQLLKEGKYYVKLYNSQFQKEETK